MDSLDTNILIRYYTDDDPVQSPLAVRLLEERAPLFVPLTVVQELFWVLESHCELPKARLLKILRHLLALPAVEVQHHEAVDAAVRYFESGLSFDDALHLAVSAGCGAFWTFDDRGFARKAARLRLQPACRIPSPA